MPTSSTHPVSAVWSKRVRASWCVCERGTQAHPPTLPPQLLAAARGEQIPHGCALAGRGRAALALWRAGAPRSRNYSAAGHRNFSPLGGIGERDKLQLGSRPLGAAALGCGAGGSRATRGAKGKRGTPRRQQTVVLLINVVSPRRRLAFLKTLELVGLGKRASQRYNGMIHARACLQRGRTTMRLDSTKGIEQIYDSCPLLWCKYCR